MNASKIFSVWDWVFTLENADVEVGALVSTTNSRQCVLGPLCVLAVSCRKGSGSMAHLRKRCDTQVGQRCEGIPPTEHLMRGRLLLDYLSKLLLSLLRPCSLFPNPAVGTQPTTICSPPTHLPPFYKPFPPPSPLRPYPALFS